MVGCALDMSTRELDRVPDGRPPTQILRADRDGPPRRVAGAAPPGLSVGGVPGAPGACARCVETGRTCPSCVQRRRFAWSLVMERKEVAADGGEDSRSRTEPGARARGGRAGSPRAAEPAVRLDPGGPHPGGDRGRAGPRSRPHGSLTSRAGWRCNRPTSSERFSARAETAGPSAASPLRTRVV